MVQISVCLAKVYVDDTALAELASQVRSGPGGAVALELHSQSRRQPMNVALSPWSTCLRYYNNSVVWDAIQEAG